MCNLAKIINNCKIDAVTRVLTQPRSQWSSAISDVTSSVKLVGKIRRGRLANNGKSEMAAPPKNATSAKILEEIKKKASEVGWDSLINVCHQIHRVVGEVSLKKSFRLYFCCYRTCRVSYFRALIA